MKKIDINSYTHGVKDALKMLHGHINSMEHAVGFSASQTAEAHVPIMKTVFENMRTLLK